MTSTSPTSGRIAEIHRYPVKSMQGELVESTTLGPLGIEGDRRLAVRDLTTGKILSAKTPKIARKLLTCSANTHETSGEVIVTVNDKAYGHRSESEALDAALTSLIGQPVALVEATTETDVYASEWPELEDMVLSNMAIDLPMLTGTFADLEPLHLLTTSSIAYLAALAPASTITAQRFRPGILIDVAPADGFIENDWPGMSVAIGSAVITFGAASPRCIMTTVAQPGMDEDKAVLQAIAAHNKRDYGGMGNFACLGIYAQVAQNGVISVGDAINRAE